MYELYLDDQTAVPSIKSRRFRDFQNHSLKQNYNDPDSFHLSSIEAAADIVIPENIAVVLSERNISEVPFIMVHSQLSDRTNKGEAYAMGFDKFLVIMWKRNHSQPFTLVKIPHKNIIDVSAGVEEEEGAIIVLMVSTEEKTYSLWFDNDRADELVSFINSWKYHQIHRIGGKTEIKFNDDD